MRAFLTIFGIAIGVFALIAMGAIAEKLTLLVDGGTKYYKDKVIVSKSDLISLEPNPMSAKIITEVEAVKGVEKAQAELQMTLDEDIGAVQMGPPASIVGTDLRGQDYDSFKITFSEGRDLRKSDINKVVVGSDLVKKLGAKVGKNVKLRGKSFEVIGIMEKTLTIPDTTVLMTLSDAQRLHYKDLPQMVKDQIDISDLVTGITAFIKDDYDPNKVAKEIKKEMPDVKAFGPKAFNDQIGNAVGIFTAIIFLIGMISLLVGGLSVINTMTMSISERTREIGIRKAIGASSRQILSQFLIESGIIGLIGGMIGLGLGWGFTTVANSVGNESGTTLFLLTLRLAIGAVIFAVLLGIIGGLFPSWRAARMNPVEALRYE